MQQAIIIIVTRLLWWVYKNADIYFMSPEMHPAPQWLNMTALFGAYPGTSGHEYNQYVSKFRVDGKQWFGVYSNIIHSCCSVIGILTPYWHHGNSGVSHCSHPTNSQPQTTGTVEPFTCWFYLGSLIIITPFLSCLDTELTHGFLRRW